MKPLKLIFSFFHLTLLAQNITAQNEQPLEPYTPAFLLSPRVGYDLPFYDNSTPYIDYLGGLKVGASADYYFNWFGLGMDFDFIGNAAKNIYPTSNLRLMGNPISITRLNENSINRMFFGLGPSFRFEPSNRFTAELKLRGGIGYINGGGVELEGFQSGQVFRLNYHAGYDWEPVLSAKAQVQFNYFFNDYIGLHAGVYSVGHYYDLTDPASGTTLYVPFNEQSGAYNINSLQPIVRREPCNCQTFSLGAFVGITLRLFNQQRVSVPIIQPSSLKVTAKDKYTKELLPNTDIALKTPDGKIVQTGTTNSFGEVTFNNIPPDTYTIEGILYDTKLEGSKAMKDEFQPGKTLQKEILYSDPNFIIKGRTVLCNTNTPLVGVTVKLSKMAGAEIKYTLTDAKGEFIFHLKQKATYTLYGKKENYLTQIDTILTNEFDRNKTLFVQLEFCMNKINCNEDFNINNIYYDSDKYALKAEYKPELNRLVQFMTDNPNLKVEIGSHTDSKNSGAYNKTLSQNRANTVVDYLVSQGISRERLVAKGYGENQLLNECYDGVKCTDDEHQKNRRTVMKVSCPK